MAIAVEPSSNTHTTNSDVEKSVEVLTGAADLELAREHETRFILGYTELTGCTDSSARCVYIHIFPHWPQDEKNHQPPR